MNFQKVEFLISAAATKDFPKNRLPEIAFAGKSNVGKSSVINRLLQRKNFARVGDKPGKTIHVNYFTIDNTCYDVPMQFISAKVEIRYLPDDMDSAFILFENEKFPIRQTNRNENCRTRRNNLTIDYSKAGGKN